MQNYHHGDRWLPGVVQQKTGPVSFRVKLNDGRMRRCHQDQLRKRTVEMPQELPTDSDDTIPSASSPEPSTASTESIATTETTSTEQSSDSIPVSLDAANEHTTSGNVKAYPTCTRQPVVRYEPTCTCTW